MGTTVLAWWMRGVRVYPGLSRVQSLNLTLGEVTKGNGRVNESCRLDTGIKGVRARGRSGKVGEKVDALK